MHRRVILFGSAVVLWAACSALPLRAQILNGTGVGPTVSALSDVSLKLFQLLLPPVFDEAENPPGKFNAVKPQEFDPGNTHLVQSAWLEGIGCPSGATIAVPNEDFTGVGSFEEYTNRVCEEGDPNDLRHEGLLLAKTGPSTRNFAAAAAELINVRGIVVTQLGFDIRKQGGHASLFGSHCGGGAPRFLLLFSAGGGAEVGCNSAPPPQQSGDGWTRLRWETPPLGPVDRIIILFDEGNDAAGSPDMFGAAILDNITVNGKIVGRGATDASSSAR